jgi:hypothetical protein
MWYKTKAIFFLLISNFFCYFQNDSLIPLNLNDIVGIYDNQRIFTLTKTASGVGELRE